MSSTDGLHKIANYFEEKSNEASESRREDSIEATAISFASDNAEVPDVWVYIEDDELANIELAPDVIHRYSPSDLTLLINTTLVQAFLLYRQTVLGENADEM